MNVHLLHRDREFDLQAALPPQAALLTQDLCLDSLLDAMAEGDRFVRDIAQRVLLNSLTDAAEIAYRQGILEDCLRQPAVVRQMYALAVETLERERQVWGWTLNRYPDAVIHRSRDALTLFVEMLRVLRRLAEEHARSFRSEGFTALLGMLREALAEDYLEELERHIHLLELRAGTLLSATLAEGNRATNYVLREPWIDARSLLERLRGWLGEVTGATEPSRYVYQLPDRDEAGMQALGEIRGRGLAAVAAAAGRGADHILGFFKALRAELAFYAGCLNLRARLTQKGLPVALPDVAAAPAGPQGGVVLLSGRALYDAALALRLERRVTGNDINADGRPLVVITGANQGGKTSFHRSLGQAQLMAQCGMFIPGEAYRATVCSGLYTHYKREEDRGLTMGKLDEELRRVDTIVQQVRPGGLVLCNESFATTHEREGSEIARQLVGGLLDAGVRVIYVTHMHDLADGWHRERSSAELFLRAERLPDGRRSFRIVPGEPLPTSYGPDLYERILGPSAGQPAACRKSVQSPEAAG